MSEPLDENPYEVSVATPLRKYRDPMAIQDGEDE